MHAAGSETDDGAATVPRTIIRIDQQHITEIEEYRQRRIRHHPEIDGSIGPAGESGHIDPRHAARSRRDRDIHCGAGDVNLFDGHTAMLGARAHLPDDGGQLPDRLGLGRGLPHQGVVQWL
ncbi:hypothetical protein Ntsu_66550 [Nocardia sp. IFM 10818]